MNLAEGIQKELERVILLKKEAEDLANRPGVFMGFYIMAADRAIKAAQKAIGEGDTVAMLGAYEQLKDFEA